MIRHHAGAFFLSLWQVSEAVEIAWKMCVLCTFWKSECDEMLYPDFTFFCAQKIFWNACKWMGHGLFLSSGNYWGAISSAEKIWISGGACCIFASRSQAAPQHSFWEPALVALHSGCTDIAFGEVRLHLSLDGWKNYRILIYKVIFDILWQQKVRQVGLSETSTQSWV